MENVRLTGVASVLAIGAAMTVAASLLALSGTRGGAAERVVRYTGYVILAVGVLGMCLLAGGWLGLIAWPIVMVIWVRAALQYRANQKRNLFGALAVAISKQMPLAPVVRAFANEQEGAFSARAGALARKLDRGMPLDEALRRSRRTLPPESALAAAVGRESGDLAGALDATTYSSVFDRAWLQPTLSRLFYLFVVVCVLSAVLSFVQIKIAPSWVAILGDFELDVPQTLRVQNMLPPPPLPESWLDWLIFQVPPGMMPNLIVSAWLTFLILVFAFIIAVVGLYIWLQWRGTLVPRLPGLRRIINWVDMAQVLRVLALAARNNRPLIGMLMAMVRLHPKRSIRSRLRRVVRDLDDGMPWYDSFRRRRLINSTDAAILTAAGHSGNLAWAMRETAESFERKANYHLQGTVQMISPLLLLPFAAATGAIAVSYFAPLAMLIEQLSSS